MEVAHAVAVDVVVILPSRTVAVCVCVQICKCVGQFGQASAAKSGQGAHSGRRRHNFYRKEDLRVLPLIRVTVITLTEHKNHIP